MPSAYGRTAPTPCSFLDPAIGTGSFYSALRRTFPPQAVADACGVEIDPPFAAAAKSLWEASGLRIVPDDFTRVSPDRLYNLVLTNPPYVRHHHLDRADKERLKTLTADRFGLDISGLAGLYAHFLLLCDAWMAPGGLAIWLIPSEFMDVNYGAAIKTYLTEHVKLLHIHRYCPSDVQFCDALVTSAIVVFEKSPAPDHHQVRFSFGGPITRPSVFGDDRPDGTPAGEEMDRAFQRLNDPPLSNPTRWAISSPSSGAWRPEPMRSSSSNGMRRSGKGIPAEFLRPILPSSRHLANAVIESEPDGYPRLKKPLVHHRLRPAGGYHQAAAPGFLEIP